MQSYQKKRQNCRNLRKPKTQTKTRVIEYLTKNNKGENKWQD